MSDVKINDQTVADSPPLGKDPVHMICPHCSHEVWTEVETKPSIYAWISGIALAIVGQVFFLNICIIFLNNHSGFFDRCIPCSCLPCCMEAFKETKHTCSNCNGLIGTVKPQL